MNALSNAKWVSFNQFGKVAIQLIGMVILARLIPPDEYGVMAMAMVVTNFALMVRDLGTSSAIIQKKVLTNEVINTIFWINLTMGATVFLLLSLFSHYIAEFFNQDKLRYVLLMLAIGFPIASSSSAHLALLERSSKFNSVAKIEILSSLVGLFLAIVFALYGFGVYSLVIQSLSTSVLSSIQLWRTSSWIPSLRFNIKKNDLSMLLHFSGYLTMFNFINYFSRNADSIIIGRFFSAVILGAYSLAYRVMLFPLQSITVIANRSLFPLMSGYQDEPDKIKKLYLKTVLIIAILVAPLMGGLLILRGPFIFVVFGTQWSYTADILLWLAPTGFIQAIISTTGSVFMARGHAKLLMKLGVLSAFLQLNAFIIGAQYDVVTLTKLYFLANLINIFPVAFYLMRTLNAVWYDMFKPVIKPMLSSLIMSILLKYVLNEYDLTLGLNTHSIWSLILLSVIGFLTYSFVMLLLCYKEIKIFINKRRHKRLAELDK